MTEGTVGNADGNASWHRLELCRVQSPGITDEVGGSESVSEEVAHAAAVQQPTARHVSLSSAIIDYRIPHPPPLSDTRYMRPRGTGGGGGKGESQTAKQQRFTFTA